MLAYLKPLLLIHLAFLSAQYLYPQSDDKIQGSPEWLVDKYFFQKQFPDKANYFTGEMIEEAEKPTIGEELNGNADVSFHKIHSENGKEVYSVEVVVSETTADFYCYLLNTDDMWKIEAVRRFVLPRFIYIAKDSLNIIENISSKDADLLRLLTLITSSDAELIKYLTDNINDFYKLVLYIEDEDTENIQNLLNKLSIDATFRDEKYPGCIFFQIGALDTKQVGYFYSSENSILPEISPNGFIIVEEILPKWFLYRII